MIWSWDLTIAITKIGESQTKHCDLPIACAQETKSNRKSVVYGAVPLENNNQSISVIYEERVVDYNFENYN